MPLDHDLPYFTYEITTGELLLQQVQGDEFMGTGYSGMGFARNKPAYCYLVAQGPIPKGWYTMTGPFDNYVNDEKHHLGSIVFKLAPDKDNQMFGRTGFLLHGNNRTNDASRGCIVMGPGIRSHVARAFQCLHVNRLKVI